VTAKADFPRAQVTDDRERRGSIVFVGSVNTIWRARERFWPVGDRSSKVLRDGGLSQACRQPAASDVARLRRLEQAPLALVARDGELIVRERHLRTGARRAGRKMLTDPPPRQPHRRCRG
jgi:hypothetical protein